jgi:uncharacterized repeat protein (TIGR01451 family)
VRAADQFTVTLVQPDGRTATSATTTGTDNSATTDNWPVTQNATYTITDTMAAGSPTPASEYIQSIACTDGNGNTATVGGSAGSWTLPISAATDYTCVVTNRAAANLSLQKSASPSPAVPGTNETYTLTVANRGPSTAVNATVTDPLPAGLSFVSADGCTAADGTVRCAAGDLAPGARRTFTLVTAVAADLPKGTIANTATTRSDTPDPDPSDNSSTTTTPDEPSADLSIVKRASSSRPVPGRPLTFELTVSNVGPSAATDVTVSDPLPKGLSFVSASDGCSFAAGTVTCAAGTLAPGRSVTYRVVTRVASSVTGPLRNTATVRSSSGDPDPGNNSSTVDVPPGPEADLSITKTPSLDSVGVGGQLFYTLVVKNDGPSDAQDVVVRDVAGAGLTLLGARGGQGSSCTVTASSVTCGLGTLAAGGSAQVLVNARVDQAGQLTNDATVDSPNRVPDARNNRTTTTITGNPTPLPQPADLGIVKSSNRKASVGAQTITYTLKVTNHGPGDATGVQVIDTPSLPVKVKSLKPSAGRCTTGLPIRCDLGTIGSGRTVTIKVVAQPMAAGTLKNSASVTGDQPDPSAGNNIDGTATKVQALLKVKKTASARTVRAGGTLSYKITVTNASPFAARSVKVCDKLPGGMVLASAKPKAKLSKGSYCWTVSTLGANTSRSFTIRVRVLRAESGRKVNTATATAPNARGAKSRAATGNAAIRVLGVAKGRRGGVTG